MCMCGVGGRQHTAGERGGVHTAVDQCGVGGKGPAPGMLRAECMALSRAGGGPSHVLPPLLLTRVQASQPAGQPASSTMPIHPSIHPPTHPPSRPPTHPGGEEERHRCGQDDGGGHRIAHRHDLHSTAHGGTGQGECLSGCLLAPAAAAASTPTGSSALHARKRGAARAPG
jgi:hypothetical protein